MGSNKKFQNCEKKSFKSDKFSKIGLYDFADIDDNFISIHHFLKWYKFRFQDYLIIYPFKSEKKISRSQAIHIIKKKV